MKINHEKIEIKNINKTFEGGHKVVALEKVSFYLKLLEIINKKCYRICKISSI